MSYQSEVISEAFRLFDPDRDFPCLSWQIDRFAKQRPFEGLSLLHATPLFKNALPKLGAIIAGGAKLTVTSPTGISWDPSMVKLLNSDGIEFFEKAPGHDYDIIFDCIGSYSHLNPKLGSVELTMSGRKYYEEQKTSSFCVDDSEIKAIEDIYGTSDGLIRAFQSLKIGMKGRTAIVFGYGKVGKGIAQRFTQQGVTFSVVEIDKELLGQHPDFIDGSHTESVVEAVREADIVVTATGVSEVISRSYPVDVFTGKVLANMGAEDEFGEQFSADHVLNSKAPLNFILEEPTRLRYLDPSFALQAECGVLLARQKGIHPGINTIPENTEAKLMKIIKASGFDV